MSEAYNIKLIQYDNGIVEIRTYDKPINADFEETTLCQLQMADLIAEHKKEYREALYLVYFENMSYRDAAIVMGKSEAQVTKLI